ncbi:MAG TPA: NAD(P)/FAD-dependent oxidoreductase, partial [Ktedonobacterales bacterium]|nr:NAD(P)/FAD-dependent oxidoreductase [Ktedonobacterales bacterium]
MAIEHVDVLIVGAGLSGIAAGYYVQTRCPQKTYAILEARDTIGGTWDLFRYPGVRSDSDMYTLGYSFRPWPERKAIANGTSILKYVRETAASFGINEKIRFQHGVHHLAWSTDDALWTVDVERGPDREQIQLTCGFLFMCTGYYDYNHGYTPDWPGMERFQGRIVHPQQWLQDLDCTSKRIVVIGSGATAVTLVPALAECAGHVTMLQRSPTYIVARPSHDAIGNWLHRYLPTRLADPLTRWKNITLGSYFYWLSRRRPEQVRKTILQWAREQLGPDYDLERDFSPRYNPWDQRLCLVPDG